jgi:glycosyltransferase involved in cell wall biosynthesis
MIEPIRVLQVISATDRGGAETWLLHALRYVDRDRVAMDFLVHYDRPGGYDAEIARLGARVFVCGGHRNLARQLYGMWRLQRDYGPYQVVHSHVDYYGGIVCLLARLLGVRARVVHSHNDTRAVDRTARLPRRMYTGLMKRFVRWFSTAGIGTSTSAAALMFGAGWSSEPRWRVVCACVDLSKFREPVDRRQVRAEFGISEDAMVFGHVGRFVDQKNHQFLVEVAERLATKESSATFVLVGEGPTKQRTEDEIGTRGLRDRFVVLAGRDDIARLMLGLFDYFLFPSLHEGLGLGLVEAQAAGLSCFVSAVIPPEAIVVPALVHQISLSAGPEAWAERIARHVAKRPTVTQPEALMAVERSFDIRQSAALLTKFYQEAVS